MAVGAIKLACAVIAAAALVTAGGKPAPARTAVKVVLDGGLTGPSAPFLVAQDKGHYRAAGLDVAIDAANSSSDAIAQIASGAADLALADINALIRYRDQNPGSSIKALFMLYNKPPYAIIARKSRGISKPKDLEGKKLAAPSSDAASVHWPLFAKLNDIDLSKVTTENIALPVREPMLAAGQVDATTGAAFSSYINLKERGVPVDDLIILPMADHGLILYGHAIIANPKFLSENPSAVKAFLLAFVRGLKDTIKDPARAVDSVVKRNEGAKKDVELERLRMAIRDNILTPEVRKNGLGAADPARLANAIDQLALIAKFKTPPQAQEIFDSGYLPAAPERRVNEPVRPG